MAIGKRQLWTSSGAKFLFAVIMLFSHSSQAKAQQQDLRLALLGTDSTHAVEFTRLLNGVGEKDHVSGARVTVAYRGGSALPISHDRIDRLSTTLQTTWNIPFVSSISELCKNIDGILLLSVDVRLRIQELHEAARCGKPIFIDKPLAGSLKDAREIATFLDQQKIPWFSASSIRYGHEQRPQHLLGAETWGPAKYIDVFALDLTYYGIHSIESLYSLMGPGVTQVTRTRSGDTDVIVATWKDGRVGTVRLIEDGAEYGAVLYREGGRAEMIATNIGYAPQVADIVQFMRDKRSPIAESETLEIFAFMQAAQESLKQGSVPVKLSLLH